MTNTYKLVIFPNWFSFGVGHKAKYKTMANAEKAAIKIMTNNPNFDLVTIRHEENYNECGVLVSALVKNIWRNAYVQASHDAKGYPKSADVKNYCVR